MPVQRNRPLTPLAPPRDSNVKSLVFLSDGKPVLVLVAGGRRRAPAKLKGLLGVRRAVIADADSVQREAGFMVGAVPPIGHRKGLPAWIDTSPNRFETIYAAAGHTDAVFPIRFDPPVRNTDGHVADVTETIMTEVVRE